MPDKEILEKIGLLPSILYIGGWSCIGILVLIIVYYIFLNVIKAIGK